MRRRWTPAHPRFGRWPAQCAVHRAQPTVSRRRRFPRARRHEAYPLPSPCPWAAWCTHTHAPSALALTLSPHDARREGLGGPPCPDERVPGACGAGGRVQCACGVTGDPGTLAVCTAQGAQAQRSRASAPSPSHCQARCTERSKRGASAAGARQGGAVGQAGDKGGKHGDTRRIIPSFTPPALRTSTATPVDFPLTQKTQ